ncbi:hypothetical protein [Levilactobacillus yiduensis]|uniref:hypothetical protein n=1 Tax=Levilactobacillus yiduensis TaxID=2953880 RepID=UPI002157277E|nr:hypothetical protein [Levilactobacillus yiduensis]
MDNQLGVSYHSRRIGLGDSGIVRSDSHVIVAQPTGSRLRYHPQSRRFRATSAQSSNFLNSP